MGRPSVSAERLNACRWWISKRSCGRLGRRLPGARTASPTSRSSRPGRRVRTAWPTWLHDPVREAFERLGVPAPWTHQVAAADLAHAGSAHRGLDRHRLGQVAGLPAARAARDRVDAAARRASAAPASSTSRRPRRWPRTSSRRSPLGLGLPGLRASTHDGDSTPEMREWTRDHAEYVLTNPDMLHRSLLPGHARWSRFFGSLRYVVVDECHHYRGVFGAHVAQILRRLRRVAALYGAHPTFVLASATVAEPEVSAGRLTGLDVAAVTDDGSPRGRTALALWEPPFVPGLGENGAPVRRSATSEVADLLTDLVVERVRTLAFVRSRRGAETVAADRPAAARRGRPEPGRPGGGLPRRLPARGAARARAGAARRAAARPGRHQRARARHRHQPASTPCCWPASRAPAPRCGSRSAAPGAAPATPSACWSRATTRWTPTWSTTPRRCSASRSRPTSSTRTTPTSSARTCAPPPRSSRSPSTTCRCSGPAPGPRVDALTEGGLLRRRPRGWFWTDRRRASDLADIRSSGGTPVRLVEDVTGRVLGTVDAAVGPRHRPRRRGLPAPGRDLAGRRARPRRVGRGRGAGRPRLLDLGPRDHRHRDPRRARRPSPGARPG